MINDHTNIYYLGYFTIDDLTNEQRTAPRASNIPMRYVTDAIKRSGYSVTRISASITSGKASCPGHVIKVDESEELVFFKSIGRRGIITRVISKIQKKIELARYFLRYVKKNDTVFVYHSLDYQKEILFLRKMIGFRLVLEVAEIYSDVSGTEIMARREIARCTKADAYLFFSELLEKRINIFHKIYAISYGTYFLEPKLNKQFFENNDMKKTIHLVYAGTFSREKGGARIAACTAKYLPNNYHIHIIGSGNDEDIRSLQNIIIDINKMNCANVTLDGCYFGNDYIGFLQNCDVGLSTQNPNGKFNDTSFPSKITSYLSNGLRVVSVKIPALECSKLNDILYYYQGDDPKSVAEAVLKIDWNKPYDSRRVIRELDENFVKSIGKIISNE